MSRTVHRYWWTVRRVIRRSLVTRALLPWSSSPASAHRGVEMDDPPAGGRPVQDERAPAGASFARQVESRNCRIAEDLDRQVARGDPLVGRPVDRGPQLREVRREGRFDCCATARALRQEGGTGEEDGRVVSEGPAERLPVEV